MDIFQLNEEEILCFFAVLVRFTTLVVALPMFGDKFVPSPVKILFGLILSVVIYPGLVANRVINPGDAVVWGATAAGIAMMVAKEVLVGVVLGLTAKVAFDAILFGANLVGTFMGLAAASSFDPHQESHSQVVAELQMAIAMLMFLTLDGHHLMLRAAMDSYAIVGLGAANAGAAFAEHWIAITSQVLKFGLQLSAPVAVCLFAVNLAFGVMAKSMPQANILVLSFSVTIFVGVFVLYLSVPHFGVISGNILERMGDWMGQMSGAMASR